MLEMQGTHKERVARGTEVEVTRAQEGRSVAARVFGRLLDERGQGTTEYAILVGVLVVIAIIAIVAFRGKVQELWDAITSGMASL